MTPRRRAVYLTDTMAEVRNLEAVAASFELTLLAPRFLGDAELTNYWPPRTASPVTRVRLAGGRLGFVLRAAWWLRRHRRRIDVVFALDNLTAALGATLARAAGGPPVVLQVGRPTAEYLRCKASAEPAVKNWLRRLLGGALIALNERAADGIGAVSDYCAAQCRRHNSNVRSIPWCGVDTAVFAPRWTRQEARRRLGLRADLPVVMLRSRIAPEKDPETFLRAVARLRGDGRALSAVYMGGELDEFAGVVARVGVDVIARKPSSIEEIPMWYVAADVDVQTSHAEGLGLSPIEALACGTPVVVSNVGGLPEVVDGGRVGTLVPPGDDEALASAIAAYLDDPAEAARVASEGQQWVAQRFGATDAQRAWAELAWSVCRDVGHSKARVTKVLFVDHETRLSGGELDLLDLLRALDPCLVSVTVALPGEGPLADALRSAGAEVHVVAMGTSLRRASRWELNRRPLVLFGHLGASLAAGARLARLARAVRPDVVHTNSMKAHLLASPAAFVARAALVWHVRDILSTGWLARSFSALASILPRRVLCISRAVEAPMVRATARGRTRVVYNGILSSPADPDAVLRQRERVGAMPSKPVVGIVGQIARWKGQDVFLDAASRIAAAVPEARFAVVGECLFPRNEGEFDQTVRARSAEPDLRGRVVWTGSVTPIEPMMAALDVLVHASRLPEPFGRVIIEAMAQGTPVVTTSIGAGPELVTDGTGRIVEPDDPAALAEAVCELLSAGDHERELRAERCRARAAQFSTRATAESVMAVYRELGVLSDHPSEGFSATMQTL